MARTWLYVPGSVVLATAVACLPACTTKRGSDTGPGGDAVATAEAGSTSGAANEAEVTRYPDQVAAHNEPMTTQRFAIVRTEAGPVAGRVLTQLPPGTTAQKLAERAGYLLVLFADRSAPTRQIEGWVNAAVFTAPPAPPAATPGASTAAGASAPKGDAAPASPGH